MTWKTLAESLESALASIANEVGEGVPAATGPCAVTSKKRPSRSPAKFQGGVNEEAEAPETWNSANRERMNAALPMGRRMTVATASPNAVGSPTRAAVIRLVIDNGGRPAEGGGVSRAAYRAGRAREFLYLVEGGHAASANKGNETGAAAGKLSGNSWSANSPPLVSPAIRNPAF